MAKPIKINRLLILAKVTGRPHGASYTVADRGVHRGRSYTYRLRAVTVGGKRVWLGSTSPRT